MITGYDRQQLTLPLRGAPLETHRDALSSLFSFLCGFKCYESSGWGAALQTCSYTSPSLSAVGKPGLLGSGVDGGGCSNGHITSN